MEEEWNEEESGGIEPASSVGLCSVWIQMASILVLLEVILGG